MRSYYTIHYQKELGLRPRVITRPCFPGTHGEITDAKETIEGIPYHRIAKLSGLSETFFNLSMRYEFRRLSDYFFIRSFADTIKNICRQNGINIVQAASPWINVQSAFNATYKLGIPVLYEVRGLWEDSEVVSGRLAEGSKEYFQRRSAEENAMMRASAIITISDALKNDFIERGISEDKIHVIYNGVDPDRFSPGYPDEELMRKLNLNGSVVLGYVSSLRKLEGLPYLIKALPHILKRADNVKILIVGKGPELHALKSLSDELRLTNKIVFTGHVPHDEIKKYYSLIDIFVIPRLNHRVCNLVTPMKPYEAMSMGKPVVVSRLPALQEMIIEDETGLAFQAENEQDLARVCLKLINNSSFRSRLGNNAREWVIRNRGWKQLVPSYKEIYERLLC